jgi:hypothetical protein
MTRPPVTYPVALDTLMLMADAASELDGMRMFFVDRPSEQDRISAMVKRLHDAVERAAANDARLIYGDDKT